MLTKTNELTIIEILLELFDHFQEITTRISLCVKKDNKKWLILYH